MTTFKKITKIDPEKISHAIESVKKHYENICKLCASCGISHVPSISSVRWERHKLVLHAKTLDDSLEHIKKKLRKSALSLKCHHYQTEPDIANDRELCESLSNYRHDLELFFRQIQNLILPESDR